VGLLPGPVIITGSTIPRGTMRPMAAIPESTRNSITVRLLNHAEAHWPQLTRVHVTYRGAFGYITGVLRDGTHVSGLLLVRGRRPLSGQPSPT
jgi:hypothetical protein